MSDDEKKKLKLKTKHLIYNLIIRKYKVFDSLKTD